MESYKIMAPQGRGTFAERLDELHDTLQAWLDEERREGRRLEYAKVFMSDIQNQHACFCRSRCFTQLLRNCALSIVEQAPLDNSKISVLAKTSDTPPDCIFHALRLNDGETQGMNSYLQTVLLFERYINILKEQGLDIATHLIRTWIYVADIDVNYQGVVKARNDIFRQHGLTADTHFVASTGIGGNTAARSASVGIDFLTCPAATAADLQFLHAPDRLNPTHEYGVAFERGTRLHTATADRLFISGTASIDRHGNVVHEGDVERQTEHLLDNINALLADGNAGMDDIAYFIVYLRDLSDYPLVSALMHRRYPSTPHIIVHAKVCRPAWLVEMECIAVKNITSSPPSICQ